MHKCLLPPSLLLPNASSWLSSHTIIPARLPVPSWQNCVKPPSSCHTPVLSLLPGFYFVSSSSTTLSNHDGTWLSLLTLTFTMLAQLFDVGYFLHLAPSGEPACLTTQPQTSRKCVLSPAGQRCINTSTAHNFYAPLPLHQFTPAQPDSFFGAQARIASLVALVRPPPASQAQLPPRQGAVQLSGRADRFKRPGAAAWPDIEDFMVCLS